MPNITPAPSGANDPWLYQYEMQTASHAVVFQTQNTFLDHNIKAQITVATGSVIPTTTNTNLTTYFTTNGASSSSNDISITPQASASAGFIPATTSSSLITGTAAYYKIKTADVQATNSNTHAEVTLLTIDDETKAGVNISNIITDITGSSITGTTAEPNVANSYFLAFKGTGSSVISTSGWTTTGVKTGASITKYFQVKEATIGVTKSSGTITPSVSITTNNVVLGDTANSGISIQATGGGSASLVAAVNVTDDGYVPEGNSYKTQTLTIDANTTSSTKYITGLTIGQGKTLSSVTNAGTLSVTNTGTLNLSTQGTVSVTSTSTSTGKVTIYAKKNGSDTNYATAEIVTSGKLHVATPGFSGGGLTSQEATASFTNISTTSTNNGITIQAIGKAGRAAVTYSSTTSGWIDITANQNASSAVNATTWAGTTYYIAGITVPKDKAFTVTSTADTAYDDTSNISITNGTYRKTIVTNSGAVYARQASNAGQVYVRDNGASTDVQVVSAGKLITTSVTSTSTTVTGSSAPYTVTRGIATWGTGWITSTSLPAALFTSTVSNTNAYVDISDTSAAPVLVSGDYLYITAGYTDNLKISLATLVPDSVTATHGFAPANYILAGYGAFNANGQEIVGTMQTYAGAYEVVTSA